VGAHVRLQVALLREALPADAARVLLAPGVRLAMVPQTRPRRVRVGAQLTAIALVQLGAFVEQGVHLSRLQGPRLGGRRRDGRDDEVVEARRAVPDSLLGGVARLAAGAHRGAAFLVHRLAEHPGKLHLTKGPRLVRPRRLIVVLFRSRGACAARAIPELSVVVLSVGALFHGSPGPVVVPGVVDGGFCGRGVQVGFVVLV